mmetsp:Transcript_119035/g.379621  ORF Transcript_119035/g.379621 Transcript_119035/m.379621 type:complete len:280 (-) Transcript_119035:1234-2073(-)
MLDGRRVRRSSLGTPVSKLALGDKSASRAGCFWRGLPRQGLSVGPRGQRRGAAAASGVCAEAELLGSDLGGRLGARQGRGEVAPAVGGRAPVNLAMLRLPRGLGHVARPRAAFGVRALGGSEWQIKSPSGATAHGARNRGSHELGAARGRSRFVRVRRRLRLGPHPFIVPEGVAQRHQARQRRALPVGWACGRSSSRQDRRFRHRQDLGGGRQLRGRRNRDRNAALLLAGDLPWREVRRTVGRLGLGLRHLRDDLLAATFPSSRRQHCGVGAEGHGGQV